MAALADIFSPTINAVQKSEPENGNLSPAKSALSLDPNEGSQPQQCPGLA
jgi:hypothetical protein